MIDSDVRREIDQLKQGFVFVAGTLSLASSPATTTTITRVGVSSGSIVSLTPYNSAAATAGIPQCVPANGSFVLSHSSSASTRTYRYVVHTLIA